MLDCPITDVLDDDRRPLWLERHLHPGGLQWPHGGSADRRLFRAQGDFPASRWRACDGYDTGLRGPIFAKTQQPPAPLVLLLRGMAKGEPTARRARELTLPRTQLQTLRQRLPANRNETAPTDGMPGTACEADALYHNAGAQPPAPS